jgi:hypothetical protein
VISGYGPTQKRRPPTMGPLAGVDPPCPPLGRQARFDQAVRKLDLIWS